MPYPSAWIVYVAAFGTSVSEDSRSASPDVDVDRLRRRALLSGLVGDRQHDDVGAGGSEVVSLERCAPLLTGSPSPKFQLYDTIV